MPEAGDVIEGYGGFRLRLIRTGEDVLEMDATYGGAVDAPPEHFHPKQAEHFEVLEGTVWTRIGGEERVCEAGETFDVPVGTPHQVAARGPARMRWEVRPALRTAEFFATLYSGEAGETFLQDFADEIRFT